MMPLTLAPTDQGFVVYKIFADQKLKAHLDHLGILVGSEITPLIFCGKDLIVRVKDCRLALNKEVASKILVKAV
ncbi:ferrous iron transport protein A [Acholeplasma sp. OttesenSCG-928-E16]|nr:ferrous iron transport protein A [Acholeplasma sp. OttesenSCG-928-E16]